MSDILAVAVIGALQMVTIAYIRARTRKCGGNECRRILSQIDMSGRRGR